jgi:hypothetical protein
VRVTNEVGTSAIATATVVVLPAPPPGAVGISINDGDFATNNLTLRLDSVWPPLADIMLVADDSGFRTHVLTMPLAPTVPWTLDQTGPSRLPETVFVRFLGAGHDTQTFADDIIFDQKPPALGSARLLSRERARAAGKHPPKLKRYRIKVKAHDRIVGVCAIAASPRKLRATTVTVTTCHHRGILRLTKTIIIKASTQPKYLRVRNSAGTWSRWVKIRHR